MSIRPRLAPTAAATAIAATLLGPGPAGAQLAFNQVALSGDLAPGVSDGAAFDSFLSPTLNSSGDVAFQGSLRTGSGSNAGLVDGSNSIAIFGPGSGAGSPLSVLAREGDVAPGVSDGAAIDFFFPLTLNSSGDVAFRAFLRSGSGPDAGLVDFNNDTAIFGPGSGAGSPLSVLARLGDVAPGVSDGAAFAGFEIGSPMLNSAGDVAFEARLRTGTGPSAGVVNTLNSNAIFGPGSGAGSPLSVLAREGDLAPGVSDGATFNAFGSLRFNSPGDVAFDGLLRTGAGSDAGLVDNSNNSAIFGPGSGAGSSLSVLARAGDLAPGASDGAVFNGVGIPTLNSPGDVAFVGFLRTGSDSNAELVDGSNDIAIFGPSSGAGSALSVLAREGDLAPGVSDGAVFSTFLNGFQALNSAGDVAFEAFLRTGSGSDAGLVDNSNANAIFGPASGAGSSLSVLAREGDLAPGVSDGAAFSNFGVSTLNSSGDVVFEAFLRTGDDPDAGGVNNGNNAALFAFVEGKLELIVREGDLFEVSLDDTSVEARTISGIRFDSSSADGFTGLNDAGVLAFALTFTDNTSGIFTVVIPEPAAGLMLLAGVGGLVGRRRRVG